MEPLPYGASVLQLEPPLWSLQPPPTLTPAAARCRTLSNAAARCHILPELLPFGTSPYGASPRRRLLL